MATKSATRGSGRTLRPRSRAVASPVRGFDLARYGGKWVATRRGEVVAVSEDFAQLELDVRRRGLQDEVILTHVPQKGAVFY